jgi:hypothetical protein
MFFHCTVLGKSYGKRKKNPNTVWRKNSSALFSVQVLEINTVITQLLNLLLNQKLVFNSKIIIIVVKLVAESKTSF